MNRHQLLAIAAGVVMAGCGGGGASPPVVPAVTGVNVGAAWRNVLTANQTWTVSGTGSDGRAYSLTQQSVFGGNGTYLVTGQVGTTSVLHSSVSVNGVAAGTSVTTQFIDVNGQLFGVQYPDGTCESVPAPPSALPGVSATGAAGSIVTSFSYSSCAPNPSAASGTTVYTWSIESDAGITLFCFQGIDMDLNGIAMGSVQSCMEAAEDGTLGTRTRLSISIPGTFSLVAKNF